MADDSLSRWYMAQQAVLGACIIDEKAVSVVLSQTTPDMFADQYREIYQAISKLFLAGHRIDPVTVRHELDVSGDLMMQLLDTTPTSANVREYVRVLREMHRLRQMQELGQQLSGVQHMELAMELMGQLQSIATPGQGVRAYSFRDLMTGFWNAHDTPPDYLRWGIPTLDEHLTVKPGSFVILGGYPSAGKTALALQFLIAQSAPPNPKRIGVFSFETDEGKLRDRSVAHAAGYSLGEILTSPIAQMDFDRITPALRQLSEQPVTVIPASGLGVAQIYSLSVAYRFDVVYIDYLQLIRRNTKLIGHEQVAEISRQLQAMAHSTGITVVALSQLSRPARDYANTGPKKPRKTMLNGEEITLPPKLYPVREPTMSDLRESGQLEQDADAIMMLWRPFPESLEVTDRYLRIAKNKDGPAGGKIVLRFDGPTQRFTPEAPASLAQRIRAAAGIQPQQAVPPSAVPQEHTQVAFCDLEENDELPF